MHEQETARRGVDLIASNHVYGLKPDRILAFRLLTQHLTIIVPMVMIQYSAGKQPGPASETTTLSLYPT